MIEDTIRNLRAGASDMRLRRANNGQEMYQLVADENDNDELYLKQKTNMNKETPWTHLTLMEQWKKLTLIVT